MLRPYMFCRDLIAFAQIWWGWGLRCQCLGGAEHLAGEGDRDHNFDHRTGVDVVQTDFAAEFFYALAHAGNANADAARAKLDDIFSEAFAVIADGNHDFVVGLFNDNGSSIRPRVAEDIGQAFLDDAENRSLEFRLEAWKFGGLYIDRSFNAAPL